MFQFNKKEARIWVDMRIRVYIVILGLRIRVSRDPETPSYFNADLFYYVFFMPEIVNFIHILTRNFHLKLRNWILFIHLKFSSWLSKST